MRTVFVDMMRASQRNVSVRTGSAGRMRGGSWEKVLSAARQCAQVRVRCRVRLQMIMSCPLAQWE